MKKTAFIICLAALFISQWVAANPISSAQALKNAQAFLQGKGISLKAKSMRRAPAANGTNEQAPYYVFNIGSDQGFVIASGDDNAYPILAYSDNGSLGTDSLPDNVQYWLDSYDEQIKALKDSKTTAAKPRRLPAKVVEPMSTSKWNQYNPYNLSCPTTQSGVRCITGCVATAMAQVMYYHRKYSTRKVLEDIPGYIYIRDEEASVETVPKGTVIDWDNMLDRYLSQQYTDEQARAVANLMLY